MRRRLTALCISAVTALGACSDSPYQPDPQALVGEYSGRAGLGFQGYDLFLAVDEVSDSVRGFWSLSYVTSCSTHDGAFSGTLSGDRLELTLRPDEIYEATFELALQVLPGDSLLRGRILSVVPGADPVCFDDHAQITLYHGEVIGLPIGR